MKRTPLPPHCRQVTPQRELLLVLQTFAPIPHPSIHPSIHLYPSYSNSTCSFSSTAAVLGVQRSFCFGGEVTRPRLLFRVHSTSSHGHQDRGQMKGSSLERQQSESRDRKSPFLLKFFHCAGAVSHSTNVCICFHKHTENHTQLMQLFLLPLILLAFNYSTLDAVICDWCQGLAEGRKKGRKHQLSD